LDLLGITPEGVLSNVVKHVSSWSLLGVILLWGVDLKFKQRKGIAMAVQQREILDGRSAMMLTGIEDAKVCDGHEFGIP